MVKIGPVELTEQEAENLYKEEKFIVTYGKIYQVCYSPNAGYYGLCVYTKPTKGIGLVKRGRFIVTSRAHAENLMRT